MDGLIVNSLITGNATHGEFSAAQGYIGFPRIMNSTISGNSTTGAFRTAAAWAAC